MPKLFVTVLDGNLRADACVPDVYFGRGFKAHGGTRAKAKGSFGKGWVKCRLGELPWRACVTASSVPALVPAHSNSRRGVST